MNVPQGTFPRGFPGGTRGKESTCPCKRCGRLGFAPWVRRTPLEADMATRSKTPALDSPVDRGVWWATYSPRGGKRRTRLSDSDRTQVFSQATLSHCISSVVMASGGITGLYRTNRVGRITRDGGGTLLVQGREPCWRRKRRTPRWGAFLSAEEEPGVPRGLGGEGPTKTGA